MEEKKKVIVVAKAGAIEIVVEGEKDDYELVLSKRQAAKLALDILYTVYKTGEKIQSTMHEVMTSQIYHQLQLICDNDTQPRLAKTQRKALLSSNLTGLHREIS